MPYGVALACRWFPLGCLLPNSGPQRTILSTVLQAATPLITLPLMVACICLSWAIRRAYINRQRRHVYVVETSASSSGSGITVACTQDDVAVAAPPPACVHPVDMPALLPPADTASDDTIPTPTFLAFLGRNLPVLIFVMVSSQAGRLTSVLIQTPHWCSTMCQAK